MKNLLNKIETTRKVICITGRVAAGKTLCMSTIANELKEEYQANLYSNYSLYGSLEINELELNESSKPMVICIDEMGHVLNTSPDSVFTLLAFTEHENVIILFDSYNIARLPESIRKTINLHLSAEKLDSDTIKITGINAAYEKVIKITESAIYYNAFDLPKLSF
jgi:Cdc6-like AAA superfamily ATPase